MRGALQQMADSHSEAACHRLKQLSVETGSLLICIALSNPKELKALQSSRLDKENFEEGHQTETFYTGLLVSAPDMRCSMKDEMQAALIPLFNC